MRRALPNQEVVRICVVGVGASGGAVVNQLKQYGGSKAHYLSLQTDAGAFTASSADNTLLLGDRLLRGVGTHGDPRLGAEAVKTSRQALQQALSRAEIVILVAGLGGGTGSGAAPLVAQLAKHMGLLTIAVVTTPYQFETKTRQAVAGAGLRALHRYADTVLTLDNDRLLRLYGQRAEGAPHPAVSIISECMRTVQDFLCPDGILKVDIADLHAVMAIGGAAFIARGEAVGPDRALRAADQATISKELGASVAEARGIVIQVRGGVDLSLLEVQAAAAYIRRQLPAQSELAVGAVIDPELGAKLQVSLIALGLRREIPVAKTAAVTVMTAPEPKRSPTARNRPFHKSGTGRPYSTR